MPQSSEKPHSPCEGWWEQRWFGRRPMEHLRLAFAHPRIEGSGDDVIGPFVLDGVITVGGGVSLQKTYVGKHDVIYDGHYDGEGRMWGTWKCGPDTGRWMIAIRRGGEATDGVEDVIAIGPSRSE